MFDICGDGILKIQDDHVAIERARLCDGLGIGRGQIEGASTSHYGHADLRYWAV